MAGIFIEAQTVAIAVGNPKTLLQIVAPTNQKLKIHEWSISFNGTSNTDTPVKVDLLRQTDAGTMSSYTLKKKNSDDAETIQSTAQHTATIEPSAGDIIRTEYVHPQTGFVWQAPFGKEIPVKGGERIGIRVTSSLSISAVAFMEFEE